jgi:hypothetical protein
VRIFCGKAQQADSAVAANAAIDKSHDSSVGLRALPMREDHRRILNAKPLARMRQFAALLGWHGLELGYIRFTPEEIRKYDAPESGIIVDYMTTDLKFNLQINEVLNGQSTSHQATIKADRYGIINIGWHPFELSEDDAKMKEEAERLRPWLDRRLYKNAKWRRFLWPFVRIPAECAKGPFSRRASLRAHQSEFVGKRQERPILAEKSLE